VVVFDGIGRVFVLVVPFEDDEVAVAVRSAFYRRTTTKMAPTKKGTRDDDEANDGGNK
jgi:hypothetical protein